MFQGACNTLMYHDVVERDAADQSGRPGSGPALYKVTPENFREHLRSMAERVGQAPTVDFVDRELNSNAWSLTFDDGGASSFRPIADELERYGWRGIFFIVADFIGRDGFLDADQIVEMRNRGHQIGSHSMTHPNPMSRCSPRELADEWQGSVRILSDLLGQPVRIASIPGGSYSVAVAEAASEAGIRRLFTSEPTARSWRVAECIVMGRFAIRRNTPASTAARLASGDRILRYRQWIAWNFKKAVKRAGYERYGRLRACWLERGEFE